MRNVYLHLCLPRRGRYYVAFGLGLMLVQVLRAEGGSPAALLAVPLFLAATIWCALRVPAAGMEIEGVECRFFVGDRHWSVALGEVASVSLPAAGGVALTFRDGRVHELPGILSPRPEPLSRFLAMRGIPVETRVPRGVG